MVKFCMKEFENLMLFIVVIVHYHIRVFRWEVEDEMHVVGDSLLFPKQVRIQLLIEAYPCCFST